MALVGFRPLSSPSGLLVEDRQSRRQLRLFTPETVDPEPTATDRVPFPLDRAVRFRTGSLRFPNYAWTLVRGDDGALITGVDFDERATFPSGVHIVELCGHVKTYLRADAGMTVDASDDQLLIDFDGEPTVTLGARSLRSSPSATITTTDDPRDIMTAVEQFSAGLQTTSPERSFPNLRGHPPAVELGATLDVPDRLSPPSTGIRIEIPAALEAIYTVAPLAFYLGAELVPAGTPCLATGEGYRHELSSENLADDVARVLRQSFILDCAARPEELYQIDLHERDRLRSRLDYDVGDTRSMTPAERLEAYLSIPFASVEPEVPTWPQTAYVEPTPSTVEALPYLVDELTLVRPSSPPQHSGEGARRVALNAFVTDGGTRSATSVFEGRETFVDLTWTDGQGVWVGEGIPLGAAKAELSGYRNAHRHDPSDRASIEATLVCNDPSMADELQVAEDVYGSREDLQFELTTHTGLSCAELEAVVTSETDFFHYVGHATTAGLRCRDGRLDLSTLDEIGVDAFFLNACRSYRQGLALVDGGAIGGIVTLSDVADSEASDVGSMVARLLNRGFPLRAALGVARRLSIVGGQYLVVGDNSVTVTQAESATPNLCRIEPAGDDYHVTMETFHIPWRGLGSVIAPRLGAADRRYLSGGAIGPFRVSTRELREFLNLEPIPVYYDGELAWGPDILDEL